MVPNRAQKAQKRALGIQNGASKGATRRFLHSLTPFRQFVNGNQYFSEWS